MPSSRTSEESRRSSRPNLTIPPQQHQPKPLGNVLLNGKKVLLMRPITQPAVYNPPTMPKGKAHEYMNLGRNVFNFKCENCYRSIRNSGEVTSQHHLIFSCLNCGTRHDMGADVTKAYLIHGLKSVK